jgi:hypothetical protein
MGDVPTAILEDRDFVVDFARYSEGILDEKFLRRKYRFAESVWESLGEDDALVKHIEDEKLRRIRDGSCKRERAQRLVADAPGVLGGIMLDAKASPKHRIDSAKVLDGLAGGPQSAPAADRFQIVINLGADLVERYDKSRAVCADDPDDVSGATQELVAIAASSEPTESDGGPNTL